MKILLVTQYFYPENFKSNDMAFELAKRGHEVSVLCGIPNYPEGVYYKGYGLFHKRTEAIDSVKIYRCFQSVRGRKAKGLFLSLNYLTFAFFGSLWALWLSIFKKFDCVIVHEPSPITQAIPAVLIKKIQKIPFYIWVLDIWPDAMSSGGGIKNKRILSAMTKLVKWIYRNSTKILISSKGFKELILKQGTEFENKLVYFPNWSDDVLAQPLQKIPELTQGYKIMMAGNLGSAQTIKAVMEAALLLKDEKEVKWIFVGDGSEKSYIEDFIASHHLEDTVFALGRFPANCMGSFYRQADAMLITLRAKFPHIRAVVPARLQNYMSSGNPIIGMADGGVADTIKEAECGICVPAEDYKGLSNAIKGILEQKNEFAEFGKNGREYFLSHYTKDHCIDNLERIIKS